jgi:hypothetical protein
MIKNYHIQHQFLKLLSHQSFNHKRKNVVEIEITKNI